MSIVTSKQYLLLLVDVFRYSDFLKQILITLIFHGGWKVVLNFIINAVLAPTSLTFDHILSLQNQNNAWGLEPRNRMPYSDQ
jgi:hypothetical protein